MYTYMLLCLLDKFGVHCAWADPGYLDNCKDAFREHKIQTVFSIYVLEAFCF